MHSLILYRGNHQLHHIDGPWLYPLLELEKWLDANPQNTADLTLYDKIIGKAGALLIVRLGFSVVRTDLISELATEVFRRNDVQWEAAESTERILCATESLLENTWDPESAFEMIRSRAQQAGAKRAPAPLLQVENLNVLREGVHVLSAIDLEVMPGDRILIRGENGAGKTTLLRAILGFLPINSGRIFFKGSPVGSSEWKKIRRAIAYVGQAERTTGITISGQEVVGIGAAAVGAQRGGHSTEQSIRAMKLTGTSHLARRPFAQLSGGEKRRVSIARALAQEPSLLVLDEPTAGLDSASRGDLLELIESAARERRIAVLMVSHDPFDRSLEGWTTCTLDNGQLSEIAAVKPARTR